MPSRRFAESVAGEQIRQHERTKRFRAQESAKRATERARTKERSKRLEASRVFKQQERQERYSEQDVRRRQRQQENADAAAMKQAAAQRQAGLRNRQQVVSRVQGPQGNANLGAPSINSGGTVTLVIVFFFVLVLVYNVVSHPSTSGGAITTIGNWISGLTGTTPLFSTKASQ